MREPATKNDLKVICEDIACLTALKRHDSYTRDLLVKCLRFEARLLAAIKAGGLRPRFIDGGPGLETLYPEVKLKKQPQPE